MRAQSWLIEGLGVAMIALGWGVSGSVGAEALPPEKPMSVTAKAVPPQSPTGWYSAAEYETAVQTAEVLGQPIALMYQDSKSTCPKHNGQRDTWMHSRELSCCVRVLLEMDSLGHVELLQKFRSEAGENAGRFIPMLFLGTASGEFLGVVPYAAPQQQFLTTLGGAIKSFGGIMPPQTVLGGWKKLEQGRKLWAEGKLDAALRCFIAVKKLERNNPKLGLFAELRKDEEQINQKGAEEVAAAKVLFDQGNRREGRTAVADICRRYAGFQPAEDAKALRLAAEGRGSPEASPAAAPPDGAAVESGPRTWTEAASQRTIQAELVAVKAGWVQLRIPSGELVSAPLARLSAADQEYAAQWAASRVE